MTGPSPLSVSKYVEMMEASAARTRRLCNEQPELAPVQKALIALEKDVHVQEGWDSPARLFFLRKHMASGRLSHFPLHALTKAIVQADRVLHIRTLESLDKLAEMLEAARKHEGRPVELTERVELGLSLAAAMGPLQSGADEDLFECGHGQRFQGVGLIHEAWMTMAESDPVTKELARNGKLYTHPRRVEIRQIHYCGRDGWNWQFFRVRRTESVALPRYCVADTHDSDIRFDGGIPEAISRICNAIASNPVPIRHYPEDPLE